MAYDDIPSSKVTPTVEYRGFMLGWAHGIPPNLRPCYRPIHSTQWKQTFLYEDTVEETIKAGISCIDYMYREDAVELLEGIRPDPTDGCIPPNN